MDLGYHLGYDSVTVSVVLFHRTSQSRQLQLLFRACVSYSRCFSYPLPYLHPLHSNICNCYASQDYAHTANTVQATQKHVKVSLCAYNHTVNYRFYLAEYMLRALCHTCQFSYSQCSRMLLELWTGFIANVHLQEHTPLSPSTVNISSLCLFCPQLPHWHHVAFICTGWPVLQKSWWQQPQQQVQHFWQESTTHYPQQPQQQQWWQPSMPNLQRGDT